MEQLSQQNIQLSPGLFTAVRDYLYEKSGLYYADYKKYLLEGRLLARLNALNLNTFQEYYRYIKNGTGNGPELQNVLRDIAKSEAYFFQNTPQLDALTKWILPELKELNSTPQLRLVSLASRQGEDIYTLAIVLQEYIEEAGQDWDVELIGIEENPDLVAHAREGEYDSYSIRNMPRRLILKYFSHLGNKFRIKEQINSRITFVNSAPDIWLRQNSDPINVMYCRNRLITMEHLKKQKFVTDITRTLALNGFLFLGQMETLHKIQHDLQLCHFPNTLSYVKQVQGET
ncbi:MAG: hypothetical protein K9N46_07415 [Candidatus Marinimicrobia bacterium]|nr:hypothetical protein [Candidatus Neomarinimicrobiota bacterium]MCF7880551.1 hypothetical protein [Candidatus Neomarinimicrobiota bacterium]